MDASAEASGRVTESTAFTSSARGRRRAEASSSSAVPPRPCACGGAGTLPSVGGRGSHSRDLAERLV